MSTIEMLRQVVIDEACKFAAEAEATGASSMNLNLCLAVRALERHEKRQAMETQREVGQ